MMNVPTPTASPARRAIAALNRLVETCISSEKDYALAAADARDPDLKHALMTRSEQRAAWVAALQMHIRELGGFPENEESAAGTMHRSWVGVRKVIEGRSDALLVEECVVAEEWARNRYARAMKELALADWSPALRHLMEEQYAAVRVAETDLGLWLEAHSTRGK